MKKFLVMIACLFAVSAGLFAQGLTSGESIFDDEEFEELKTKTQVIVPENQHITDKNASVKIEYSPVYDEIHIYYETLYVTYEQGEAMNTVIACVEDFMKEYNYFHYRYLQKSKSRFFRDERGQKKAEYRCYIKFDR